MEKLFLISLGGRGCCFQSLFLGQIEIPGASACFGVLKKFRLRFHQLNPSCFTKLPVYVWACKSQLTRSLLEI